MARVNILTIHENAVKCFPRQSPIFGDDKNPLWQGLSFVFNQPVLMDDMVVVYDYPPQNIKIEVNTRQQVILLMTEAFDRHPPEFVRQFGMVVSQQKKPADYDGVWINHHGCLEWWYGVARDHSNKIEVGLNWQGLANSPTKTNERVSIISSNKNMPQLPGHAMRNDFVAMLEGSDLPLDVFGFGRRPLQDKMDGLLHYPYHIALENSFINDYWTEKLADGLLAESFIFYAGCKNIEKYFDKNAIVMLDINDPTGAIAIIKKTMADNQWQQQQVAIKANKKKLMLVENIYPFLLRLFVDQGLLEIVKTDG